MPGGCFRFFSSGSRGGTQVSGTVLGGGGRPVGVACPLLGFVRLGLEPLPSTLFGIRSCRLDSLVSGAGARKEPWSWNGEAVQAEPRCIVVPIKDAGLSASARLGSTTAARRVAAMRRRDVSPAARPAASRRPAATAVAASIERRSVNRALLRQLRVAEHGGIAIYRPLHGCPQPLAGVEHVVDQFRAIPSLPH